MPIDSNKDEERAARLDRLIEESRRDSERFRYIADDLRAHADKTRERTRVILGRLQTLIDA